MRRSACTFETLDAQKLDARSITYKTLFNVTTMKMRQDIDKAIGEFTPRWLAHKAIEGDEGAVSKLQAKIREAMHKGQTVAMRSFECPYLCALSRRESILALSLLEEESNQDDAEAGAVRSVNETIRSFDALIGNVLSLMGLSNREREVAVRVLMGKRNKAIAKELFITEQSVKQHVNHILKKIRGKNRSDIFQAVQASLFGMIEEEVALLERGSSGRSK